MAVPYSFWFKFIELQTSSNPSIGYLYNLIYVAKGTAESFNHLTAKEQVAGLVGLDPLEIPRIERAFDYGITNIYVAITSDFATYDLTMYDGNHVSATAFTQIISPDFAPKTRPQGADVVIFHSAIIPSELNPDMVGTFYDPLLMGIGLGVFAKFLTSSLFFNQQLVLFPDYTDSAVVLEGEATQLKGVKASFLALDEANNTLLGYWTIGGKASADPYIYELWKFNVKNELKNFLQADQPSYSDEEILKINDVVDKVSDSIKRQYTGVNFSKAITPLRDEQIPADIDNQTVSGVKVDYTPAGAIWFINLTVKEA